MVRRMLSVTTLREAFSHFPQGVVLVAAEIDGVPHGLVASTFTVGVSLDPPLVSLAVQHSSQTWPLLAARPVLGVSLLGRDQSGVARQLASTSRENRFSGVPREVDENGALTLQDAPATMSTQIYGTTEAGDHDLVLLEVLSIDSIPGAQAMVFHRSAFKELSARDLPA
ncbi:flavin reductase family protein [Brachybacterium fresconis]